MSFTFQDKLTLEDEWRGALLSTHMASRDTLADWSPFLGLAWPKLHLWLGTVMRLLSSLQSGRSGARERQEEPAFVLPPGISLE